MMSRKSQATLSLSIGALSLAALSISSPAFAEPAAQPAKAAPTAEAKAGDDKVICRKVEVIGSRLRSERVCMTSQQWAAKKQEDRQMLDQRQTQRYKSN